MGLIVGAIRNHGRMGEKKRKNPYEPFAYDTGLSRMYEDFGKGVFARSGISDSIMKMHRAQIGAGTSGVMKMKMTALANVGSSGVLGRDALGLNKFASGIWGPSPFGLKSSPSVADQLRGSILKTSGLDRFRQSLLSSVSVGIGIRLPGLLDGIAAPLAPSVPDRAEELADRLFPPNLQDFTADEWAQLIDIATEDGIGLMWAPSSGHLHALLAEKDREGRYVYLLQHQGELLDELATGMEQVTEGALQDLVQLGSRSIECARAGMWEGALALATNVLYTAMEDYGINWYRTEFDGIRDQAKNLIKGQNGAGGTVEFVVTNVPMPERRVGIFGLRAHLVVRPLSDTFKKSTYVQGQHNRHAVAHEASYESLREEYVVPAMLNMHALLRGLDEKMAEGGLT